MIPESFRQPFSRTPFDRPPLQLASLLLFSDFLSSYEGQLKYFFSAVVSSVEKLPYFVLFAVEARLISVSDVVNACQSFQSYTIWAQSQSQPFSLIFPALTFR